MDTNACCCVHDSNCQLKLICPLAHTVFKPPVLHAPNHIKLSIQILPCKLKRDIKPSGYVCHSSVPAGDIAVSMYPIQWTVYLCLMGAATIEGKLLPCTPCMHTLGASRDTAALLYMAGRVRTTLSIYPHTTGRFYTPTALTPLHNLYVYFITSYSMADFSIKLAMGL